MGGQKDRGRGYSRQGYGMGGRGRILSIRHFAEKKKGLYFKPLLDGFVY